MKPNRPSATAYRVAMMRAAHQILDRPLVLDDPIALRIAGAGAEALSTRSTLASTRAARADWAGAAPAV